MDENPYQTPESDNGEKPPQPSEPYRGILMQVFVFLSAFVGGLYTWDTDTFLFRFCFYASVVLAILAFVSLMKMGYGPQAQQAAQKSREEAQPKDSDKNDSILW